MKKTEKQSRAEEVTVSIRERIYNGQLPAGTRLIEQEIAKEFGVSRGPVREALQELEHEGLVISEVNKGSTIANLSAEDAYEIFYLRGTLEKMALEKCGGRLLDSSILSMRNVVEDMKTIGDRKSQMGKLIAYDERFHEEILKSSKMPRLWKLWKYLSPLNGAMFLKVEECYQIQEEDALANFRVSPRRNRKSVWAGHQEMLEVLEKGNLEESVKIIENHYFSTGEMIYRWEKRREEP
ncbi:MAG: GntR family transcriptional regulator [Eubacteriales bacterium]|nr:GntR family transcriptional regulator [Eubacteriales bacterium]